MSKNTVIAILITFTLTLIFSIFISSTLLKKRLSALNHNVEQLNIVAKQAETDSKLVLSNMPFNIKFKLYEVDGIKLDNTNQRAFTIEEFIEYYSRVKKSNVIDISLLNKYFEKK